MRTYGYARVSRSEQAEDTNALFQQQNRLKKAGAEEIFTDVQSGKMDDRPALAQLLELVRHKQVEQVVITRFDRIARKARFNAEIMQLFEQTGVVLNVLDEGVVDFGSPHGWKRTQQAGIDAEFESRMLSRRVKDGYVFLREEQKANPRTPYGYQRVAERYVLDMDVFAIARATIETYLEVRSLPETLNLIYDRYGKRWSISGLRNWLLNPTLLGHTCYGQHGPRSLGTLRRSSGAKKEPSNLILENTHPDQALLSQGEEEQIRAILQHNIDYWGANSKENLWCNPFQGLIVCGQCGRTMDMLGKASGGKRTERRVIRYAYCRTRNRRLLGESRRVDPLSGEVRGERCPEKSVVRYWTIEAALIEALISKAKEIAIEAERPLEQVDPPELQALKAELAFYQAAPGTRAEGIVQELLRQIASFRHAKTVEQVKCSGNRELLMQVYEQRLYWKTLTNEQKREIFKALVRRVVIKEGKIAAIEFKGL